MRPERWSIVPGVSRRTLPIAVVCGLVTFPLYRWGSKVLVSTETTVDFSPEDAGTMSALLIVGTCITWVVLFTGAAICTVIDMVIDLRARRAEKREVERKRRAARLRARRFAGVPNGEHRVGCQPVRPEDLAA
ncbi:hypothetical protein [Streptomyces sp.]|uniref:hypothetical protein n=1 Tax=Streptomyces sp. TaxID=1931 RepID=UPI002F943C62